LLTEFEKGWVTGLIDGEGCLTYNPAPRIIITNTNLFIILKLQSLLGGTLTTSQNAIHTCWNLVIGRKYWQNWLWQLPLLEKETLRQQFLYEASLY